MLHSTSKKISTCKQRDKKRKNDDECEIAKTANILVIIFQFVVLKNYKLKYKTFFQMHFSI